MKLCHLRPRPRPLQRPQVESRLDEPGRTFSCFQMYLFSHRTRAVNVADWRITWGTRGHKNWSSNGEIGERHHHRPRTIPEREKHDCLSRDQLQQCTKYSVSFSVLCVFMWRVVEHFFFPLLGGLVSAKNSDWTRVESCPGFCKYYYGEGWKTWTPRLYPPCKFPSNVLSRKNWPMLANRNVIVGISFMFSQTITAFFVLNKRIPTCCGLSRVCKWYHSMATAWQQEPDKCQFYILYDLFRLDRENCSLKWKSCERIPST